MRMALAIGTAEAARTPAAGAQQQSVVMPRGVELIGTECRPIEACCQSGQRGRDDLFVHLYRKEHRVQKRLRQEIDDLACGWCGVAQVETFGGVQGVPPGRRDKGNEQLISWQSELAEGVHIVHTLDLDGQPQDREVLPCELKHLSI